METIVEKLVELETARLAQQKGFDLHVCRCGGYPECICYDMRPTQSILQRWLREVHNIQVYVVSGTTNGKKYRDYVGHVCPAPTEIGIGVISTAINDPRDEEYQTYEEALEAALLTALELI